TAGGAEARWARLGGTRRHRTRGVCLTLRRSLRGLGYFALLSEEPVQSLRHRHPAAHEVEPTPPLVRIDLEEVGAPAIALVALEHQVIRCDAPDQAAKHLVLGRREAGFKGVPCDADQRCGVDEVSLREGSR